jgi:transposase
VQAPAPDLPIKKGRPGAGLIANVVVSKYLDGLPLYRQSAILSREGIEIERATLADWSGIPLGGRRHLPDRRSCHGSIDHPHRRHADRGRPLAAYYRFSPDRRGERQRDHLAGFRGVIQADAFRHYEALTRPASAKDRVGRGPPLIRAACWAHARRKLYEVFESTKSPIAEAALERIGELYRVDAENYWPTGPKRGMRRDRTVLWGSLTPCRAGWWRSAGDCHRKVRSPGRIQYALSALGSADPLCR